MKRTHYKQAKAKQFKPSRPRSRGRVVCCEMANPAYAVQAGSAGASQRRVPISRRNWPTYQNVHEGLRQICPPALPVVVQSGRLAAGVLGTCIRDRSRFLIRLSHELDEAHAIETLVHEWAHALAWSLECDRMMKDKSITADDYQVQSHGATWGVAYAKTWQTLLQILAALDGGRG